MADHKVHMKLTGYHSQKWPNIEINLFGDDPATIVRLAGQMTAQLESQSQEEAPQGETRIEGKPEMIDETVERAAMAFLANCDVHKTQWYENPSSRGGTFRGHKASEPGPTVNAKGFCDFSRVAKLAWETELKNLDWDEGAVKAYLDEHFPKATHFGALSEEDQARAIAILRIGNV